MLQRCAPITMQTLTSLTVVNIGSYIISSTSILPLSLVELQQLKMHCRQRAIDQVSAKLKRMELEVALFTVTAVFLPSPLSK